MLFQDRVQHAVHERGTLSGRELLREFDRFVDRHLRRRVGVGKLPHSESKDAAIDAGLAAWGPLGGQAFDPRIGRLAGAKRLGGDADSAVLAH